MFPVRPTRVPRRFRSLDLAALLLVVFVGPLQAQTPASVGGASGTVLTAVSEAELGKISLLVGRSAVLNVGAPIARVSLTRPEIADAVPTSSQQLLIHGKAAGAISMFVWDHAGVIRRYEVTVLHDLTPLLEQMRNLFPGEPISVSSNGRDLVISGTVSSKYVVERAADVAAGYVEKKENVVNLLKQQEGIASNQVLLRVRFAEVSRSALTELGASLFTTGAGYKDYVARTTTQQFAAPFFDEENGRPKLVFSDYLNLFLFNNKEGLGAVIRALQAKGLMESLAEPNLVAENGKEASFLAGGEYPYPAVQGTGGSLAISIVFKEFGVRLSFLPTILGNDLIHLKVRPEVSSLDFTNAISYQGFRIPSLSTRRAETELELRDGQTFAIAGLMNNTMTSTLQKIPGIGDIPILGKLFQTKAAQKAQTELVVMITPQILRRNSMGAAENLPDLVEPFLPPPARTIPPPPPYLGAGRSRSDTTPPAFGGKPTEAEPPAAVQPPAQDPPVPVQQNAAPPAQSAAPATPPAASAPAPPVQQATPPAPPLQNAAPPAPPAAPAAAPSQPLAAAPGPPVLSEKELKAQREELKKQQEALAKQQREEAKRRDEQQKEEARRLEVQRKEEAKRLEQEKKEEARRAAEQAKADRERLEKARKAAEKAEKERVKREAEAAERAAAIAEKRAEAERERQKLIEDATEQLKAAQAALAAARSGGTKKE